MSNTTRDASTNTIQIEIAYAPMEEQFLYPERVTEGTTVNQALLQSALLKRFPKLNLEHVGIFGRLVTPDTVLHAGDRIEVYRPLKVDPRDRRRQQVEEERKQDRIASETAQEPVGQPVDNKKAVQSL